MELLATVVRTHFLALSALLLEVTLKFIHLKVGPLAAVGTSETSVVEDLSG